MDDSDSDNEHVNRRRIYKPRIEYPNACVFRERFRLMPWQAERLLNIIGPRLAPNSQVLTSMSAKDKLLTALRFYASNNFLLDNKAEEDHYLNVDIDDFDEEGNPLFLFNHL